jgi:hypothetical protein
MIEQKAKGERNQVVTSIDIRQVRYYRPESAYE